MPDELKKWADTGDGALEHQAAVSNSDAWKYDHQIAGKRRNHEGSRSRFANDRWDYNHRVANAYNYFVQDEYMASRKIVTAIKAVGSITLIR